jgi:hypothetical protein
MPGAFWRLQFAKVALQTEEWFPPSLSNALTGLNTCHRQTDILFSLDLKGTWRKLVAMRIQTKDQLQSAAYMW